MPEWKELWRARKEAKAPASGTGTGSGNAADHRIHEQVAAHKRQRMEAKASTVPVPVVPGGAAGPDPRAQQQEVVARLAQSGFFDDAPGPTPDPPVATAAVPAPTPRASAPSAADQPAGRSGKKPPPPDAQPRPPKPGAAVPEGFFDDQKQDAKARNAMQEYQTRMRDEMAALQLKISEELEAQYEEHQQASATLTMVREMGELQDMAAAHERLEALRLRLEEFQKARGSRPAAEPAVDAGGSESGSDVEAELEAYDWRLKASVGRPTRSTEPAARVVEVNGAVIPAPLKEEGEEEDSDGDESEATPPVDAAQTASVPA